MDFKDVLAKITDIAPQIGSFFGAPGIVAGTAVKILGKTFGLGEDAKPEEIIKALGDPEAQIKLLVAQQTYELEVLKENFKDTQNARIREIEHERITGKTDYNLYILAWVIVIGFFVLTGILLKIPVPEDQNGVIFMLFGALVAGFGQVLQFFFGSSKGSQDKSEQMAQMRKTFL